MKSVSQISSEKSLMANPHKQRSDYSVHYENDLTKMKFKKVYNIEDERSEQSLEGFAPKIIENSDEVEKKDDQVVDSNRNGGSDANSDNKRRRSGNLNSSNEENSPKICQEKKKSKIEQRQKMFEVS